MPSKRKATPTGAGGARAIRLPQGMTLIGRGASPSPDQQPRTANYLGLLVSAAASRSQCFLFWEPASGRLAARDHPERLNGTLLRRQPTGPVERLSLSRFVRLESGDTIGFPLEWFRVRIDSHASSKEAYLSRDLAAPAMAIRLLPPSDPPHAIASLDTHATHYEWATSSMPVTALDGDPGLMSPPTHRKQRQGASRAACSRNARNRVNLKGSEARNCWCSG